MIPDLFPRMDNEVFDFEGEVLADLARRVSSHCVIVEVGCYRGRSTAFLAHGSHLGARVPVYAVDVWTDAKANPPGLRETFDATMAKHGHGLVTAIQGPSHDVARGFAGLDGYGTVWLVRPPRIGLLHIDGSHRPDDLRLDIQLWTPMVEPGGVVVFHDFEHPELRQVIDVELDAGEWQHQPLTWHKLHRVGVYRRRDP